MHPVLMSLVVLSALPVICVSGHEQQSTLLDQNDEHVDSSLEHDNPWHSTIADAKSKTKKPAFTLVRPLWMDPRETWRALEQNDQQSKIRRTKKRNKQVDIIASRLNKSLLRMQTNLVAFRWNLQRTVPLQGKLSSVPWSNVKRAGSFEFCGNNATATCKASDGTSFISPTSGLYQLQFNGIFSASKSKNTSACGDSISIQMCLDHDASRAVIISMAPISGKTFHGSAWGLLWLETGQSVSVLVRRNKSSSLVKLKRSGTFFSGLLVRQGSHDTLKS